MLLFRTLPLSVMMSAFILIGCQSNNTMTDQNANTSPNINHSAETKAIISEKGLSNYRWQLVSAIDSNKNNLTKLINIKDKVELSFNVNDSQRNVNFGVGCNSMSGHYTLKDNVLTISEVISTQMLCETDIDAAENILAKSMYGASQLTLTANKVPLLTQIANNGSVLVWKGELTSEAKYGVKPEIIYWQIASQTQPCPGSTTQKCLKVRPIVYNQQGIQTMQGEWRLFNGNIEGYTHDSTLDQILRLKRFTIDPVDVKGKQTVYVVDRVVESGLAE